MTATMPRFAPHASTPGEILVAVAIERAVRQRIVNVLESTRATVTAAVDSPAELGAACPSGIPHVTIVDWAAGAGGLRRVAESLPGTRLVVIMAEEHLGEVRAAVRAGADGVVLRSRLAQTLAVVVSAVVLGQASVPRERRVDLREHGLSPRERDILRFVARGLPTAEIARELALAPSTVTRHLTSAYSKLGISSRKHALEVLADSLDGDGDGDGGRLDSPQSGFGLHTPAKNGTS
jgi:DNA-binding NarL/FixJ family response regulator